MYIYCSKTDDSGFSTTMPSLQRYMFFTGFGRRPGSCAARVEWDFRWQYLQASSWSYIFDPRWSIISCITSKLLWDMIMGWQYLKSTIKRYCDLDMLILLGLGSSGVALQSSKTPSGLYRHHPTSTEMVFQSWNLRRKKQHIKFRLVNYFRNGSGDGWTETGSWGHEAHGENSLHLFWFSRSYHQWFKLDSCLLS